MLVVQGYDVPIGMPRAGRNRTVVRVRGDHALRQDLPAVEAALTAWLAALLSAAA